MAKNEVPGLLSEDSGESLAEWARANSNKLTSAGIAVAVVLAAGMLWRASAQKKETNASAALASAENVVASGNAALAQSDLQTFLKRYGGTKGAVHARMLLAKVLFDQGKFEEGLQELDGVKAPGPYAASFQALRAAGLEQAGKSAEAAQAYEAAAAASGSAAGKAVNLSDAARAYLAAGKPEEARRIWSAMAADDAGPMAGEARVRLGELNAKPIS